MGLAFSFRSALGCARRPRHGGPGAGWPPAPAIRRGHPHQPVEHGCARIDDRFTVGALVDGAGVDLDRDHPPVPECRVVGVVKTRRDSSSDPSPHSVGWRVDRRVREWSRRSRGGRACGGVGSRRVALVPEKPLGSGTGSRPGPRRGTRIWERAGPSMRVSLTVPLVSPIDNGRPRPSQIRCSLQLKPPRQRP